jgi:hypothetical protein
MAKRRLVRKVERDSRTLDERFWPVGVALVALSAFLVGMASVSFNFDDPRWRTNGFVVCGAILVAAISTAFVLRRLGQRYGKHLLQAALILSILLHLVIGIAIVNLGVPSRVVVSDQLNAKNRAKKPDEELDADDTPIPLEMESTPQERPEDRLIEVAEAEAAEMSVERDDATKTASAQVQPRELPDVVETINPSVLDHRDSPTPTPKLADAASQLSKRHVAEPLAIDSQVTPVDDQSAKEPALAELKPSELEVQPTESAGVAERKRDVPTETLQPRPLARAVAASQDNRVEPTPVPRKNSADLARNLTADTLTPAAETTPSESMEPPQLAINRRQPEASNQGRAESQRVEAMPEQVDAVSRPREHKSEPELNIAATPTPRANDLRRLTTESDAELLAVQPNSDVSPATQPSDTQLVQRDSSTSATRREMVASADAATVDSQRPLRMVRSTQALEAPSTGAIDRQVSAAPSISSVADPLSEQSLATSEATSQEGLRPTDSSIARQAEASLDSTDRQQPSDVAEQDNIASLAREISRRELSSDVPTLLPQVAPAETPRRAMRVADLQSPAPVESPALAETPASESPTAQPQLVALDRGQFGEAGSGVSRNMRDELPGPERPSPVASGAARRPEAVANPQDQPRLNAGQSATVALSRSSENQPNIASQAVPVDGPTTSQVQSEPRLAAAGVAIEQTRTAATDGEFSADRGDLSVDVGPTRIMSEFQTGRTASGGGQPDLSSQLTQQNPTKRSAGGVPKISLATDVPGDVVAAAAGQGGGRPQALDATPLALGPRRAEPGVTAGRTGSVVRAETAGPPAEMSAADLFGPLALMRANGIQADPSSSIVGNATPENSANQRSPSLSSSGNLPQDAGDSSDPASSRLAGGGEVVDAAPGPPLPGGGSLARSNRSVRGPQPFDSSVLTVDDIPIGSSDLGVPKPTRNLLAGADIVSLARNAPLAMSGGGMDSRRPGNGATQSGGRTGSGSDSRVTPSVTGINDYVALSEGAGQPDNVDIAAKLGVGGIGRRLTPTVGSVDRDAREDSKMLATTGPRFIRRNVGGRPQISATAATAADAFRDRMELRTQSQPGSSAGPLTDETIELGLTFLARYQLPSGGWTLAGYGDEEPAMVSDAAATGLALLAFQGAGYHHLDFKYDDNIRDALKFLVSNQREDGGLFIPGNPDSNAFAEYYTHGIAAIALCEAYGMTQDPWLKQPAQKSLDFIVKSQTVIRPQGAGDSYGGWRYSEGMGPDTSVSGWMLMALKSGELAGLEVPQETYTHIQGWLKRAQASEDEPHLYRYNPFAGDDASRIHGRRPSKTMTAVGLLMRLYLGWDRDSSAMQMGGDYLAESPPAMGSTAEPIRDRSRDTYYWYYATQVMFHLGGENWKNWNEHLQELLVTSQIKRGPNAGSWDPIRPVPDRWAGNAGRLYVTTLNLLSLEIPYRHLPLHEDTAK